MSKHLYGLIVTPHGAAANNRGENEGNITTLQKILWNGESHTTVSAEAIRFALRYAWQRRDIPVNRVWNELTEDHEWQDPRWLPWTDPEGEGADQDTFIDDDVLGFMLAEAAQTDGSDVLDTMKKDLKSKTDRKKELSAEEKKSELGVKLNEEIKELRSKIKTMSKGKCDKRRGVLEVSRAISLAPFAGDITFNAKSGTKERTSLYGTEVHATRYQYGFALTPQALDRSERILDIIDALVSLSDVAGNQSRFLYDFSPEILVLRWTDDFAPRMLYGFTLAGDQKLCLSQVLDRMEHGDIDPGEVVVGTASSSILTAECRERLQKLGVAVTGVKVAAEEIKSRAHRDIGLAS